ncbi:protein BCAP isoform X1 [Struthio camelus]|uniref:protein BCAP isoform X1 n=2 Tax=Struthio camelus TaxID=8801 RepID=UPI0036042B78
MSSSSPSSSSFPARNCTVPLLDSDFQETLFLPDVTEGKICVPPVTSGEAAKFCSLIQPYKKDCCITTKAGQDGNFTDLSKESDCLEHQFAVRAEEETWKQNWGLCAARMDKHKIKLTKRSPLLKKRSQKTHVQQNLNESEVCKLSTSAMTIIAVQEGLLIKELETLQSTKRLLWLLLQTTEHEHLSSKNVDTLMQKLNENETRNISLKREMLEREERVKELSSRLQLEKVNVVKADHLSRSVKAVQTHLQCQIQKKEVENDELKVKIQTLEKKIAQWKLQAHECKQQISALRQTSEQKKTALKKASRSQKQRAEHFEAAVENITSRIREREVKLSEILSTSNVWKKQHDKIVEEKTMLEIQTEDLKKQITSLLEDLKKKEEYRRNSNEELLGKLSSVNSENENINIENEKLKASLAVLKTSTVSVESELLDLQEKAKLQENLVEQYKNQVQKLQTEAEELKSRYETVLNENKTITETKCLEVDKEEDSIAFLGSHSLEEENCNIQKKYEDLKRQLEEMEFQNEEFANQLAKQDESLQCSKLQLKEKIAECDGLARQLQSALEEGRKMVSEEMEKISYKQQALQTKMLVLETELREREEEKKQLLCMFHHSEKHQEVCLKELENRLQKSENKTQSIQNYVEFLKASYVTMFG